MFDQLSVVTWHAPDKLRKRGTDCAIHLRVDALLEDNIPIYVSAAGAALIPATIAVKYIVRAILHKDPKLTMHSRPRPDQLAAAIGPSLKCLDCGLTHNRGYWWCLGCWEPLTWVGVHYPQALLRDDRTST